jgi:cell division GTPase FtsZ
MLATRSETLRAIQLGKQVSKGLGTGANPLLGTLHFPFHE